MESFWRNFFLPFFFSVLIFSYNFPSSNILSNTLTIQIFVIYFSNFQKARRTWQICKQLFLPLSYLLLIDLACLSLMPQNGSLKGLLSHCISKFCLITVNVTHLKSVTYMWVSLRVRQFSKQWGFFNLIGIINFGSNFDTDIIRPSLPKTVIFKLAFLTFECWADFCCF